MYNIQPNPFKYHNVYKQFGIWGTVVIEPKWSRGGNRPRRGPYNKSRECTRRVRQQII